MKILLISFAWIFLCSCGAQNLNQESTQKNPGKKYRARITYYSVGQDRWGDRVACPKTRRAQEGVTVAAHPNFKFGTEIFIPELKDKIGDGRFVVQDRGGAVTKKSAARGTTYVFDVFVKSKKSLWNHAYNRPMYMDVYVY